PRALVAVRAALVLVVAAQVVLVVALQAAAPVADRRTSLHSSTPDCVKGPATAPSTFPARPRFVLGRD
ncbi:MAG: hypothetical protein ACE10O_05570, partial [Candidatus Acidiferrales bacterium]